MTSRAASAFAPCRSVFKFFEKAGGVGGGVYLSFREGGENTSAVGLVRKNPLDFVCGASEPECRPLLDVPGGMGKESGGL